MGNFLKARRVNYKTVFKLSSILYYEQYNFYEHSFFLFSVDIFFYSRNNS